MFVLLAALIETIAIPLKKMPTTVARWKKRDAMRISIGTTLRA